MRGKRGNESLRGDLRREENPGARPKDKKKRFRLLEVPSFTEIMGFFLDLSIKRELILL